MAGTIAGRELLLESFIDISDRKRVEAELRLAQFSVEHASDAIMWVNPRGRIFYANGAACRVLEYTREELLALSVPDINPDIPVEAWSGVWGKIKEQRTRTFESRHRSKQGRVFPVEVMADYLQFDAQEFSFAFVRDVTERKRAEETLRKSEERYRLLFEQALAGVFRASLAGRILDCNQAFANILGYESRQEVIDQVRFCGLCGPADFEILKARLVNETPLGNLEVQLCRKDGTTVWILGSVSVIEGEMGEDSLIAATVIDITKRKQAEQDLAQERELLGALMATVPDYIYFKDREGRFLRANTALARAVGLPDPDLLVGKSHFDFYTPEHAQEAFDDEQEVIRTGEPMTAKEEKERWPDGRETWLSTTRMPYCDRYGTVLGTLAVSRNITERKQAEAMREAKEAAEAASRFKSQFLASMSHEIRTPLNGVIGMTKLLLCTVLSPEQQRYAQVANTCGESLLAVINDINDILDFSKIEARKLSLEVIAFDLRAMLESSIEILSIQANENKLDLTCTISPEVPSLVRGDAGRLRQILLNLAGNALKFTPRGEVAIRVQADSETERTVTLRIAVEDTGIGIAPDRFGQLAERLAKWLAPTPSAP